jgi:hypothetical protein
VVGFLIFPSYSSYELVCTTICTIVLVSRANVITVSTVTVTVDVRLIVRLLLGRLQYFQRFLDGSPLMITTVVLYIRRTVEGTNYLLETKGKILRNWCDHHLPTTTDHSKTNQLVTW